MPTSPRTFRSVLITGITGSGGSYMAEYAAAAAPDADIHGLTRWHSTGSHSNLAAVADRVTLHECDLCDLSSVFRALQASKPDLIIHMASLANVYASFQTPLAVINNNVMGTANLLEGMRLLELDPLVVLCSTCEVYGQVEADRIPIDETCPLRPANPYAVSKATQDHLGLTWFRAYGQRIIRTRMFNYINPRRSDLFATSFALQVARIEAGLQDELVHGNLDSVRSLIDVRDAMDAYWQAALFCEPGQAYNMGGSTVMSVGDFLELLKAKATCSIRSRVSPDLLRPTDVARQIPDTRKFQAATGWTARWSFDDTVQHLLDHVRGVVAHELVH